MDIIGDEALISDFTKASVLAGVRARVLVEEGGEKVAEAAQNRVPVRRGQLRDSITSEMVDMTEAEIGPENALGGGYGHIVEKGLAGRPPQPFLSPALDDAESEILKGFDKMVGDLL